MPPLNNWPQHPAAFGAALELLSHDRHLGPAATIAARDALSRAEAASAVASMTSMGTHVRRKDNPTGQAYQL